MPIANIIICLFLLGYRYSICKYLLSILLAVYLCSNISPHGWQIYRKYQIYPYNKYALNSGCIHGNTEYQIYQHNRCTSNDECTSNNECIRGNIEYTLEDGCICDASSNIVNWHLWILSAIYVCSNIICKICSSTSIKLSTTKDGK